MLELVLPLFVGLAIVGYGLSWTVRRPERVVAVSCAFLVLDSIGDDILKINLGSINLIPFDPLSIALFIVSFRTLLQEKIHLTRWAGWSLAALFVLSVAGAMRGIYAGYPVQVIANTSRQMTVILAYLFYFTTYGVGHLDVVKTSRVLMLGAVGCALVATLRFAGVMPLPAASGTIGSEIPRAIYAPYAMFVASVSILYWFRAEAGRTEWWERACALAFLPLVVVLQHRSVWLAFIAMIVVGLLFGKVRKKVALPALLVIIAGYSVYSIAFHDSPLVRSLDESSERALEGKDTVNWRYDNWSATLAPEFMGDDVTYLIGRPVGKSFARKFYHRYISAEPHNYYVALITQVGGLGLVAMLVLTGTLAFKLLRLGTTEQAWGIVIVGQMVYWVSYSASPYHILFVAIGYVVWRRATIARAISGTSTSSPVLGETRHYRGALR